MSEIIYSASALKVPGKKGILTPDANGYYTVCLGAIGASNRTGLNYPLQTNRHHFEGNSIFMEAIRNGSVYAENGHPKPNPGESPAAFISRASYVSEDRTCAHIGQIWLDDKHLAKEFPGAMCIFGKVKPYGELKHVVEEAFANGMQNACFSIRCLKNDYISGGKRCRDMKEVITFDFVNDPGMAHARKQYSPGFESVETINTDVVEFTNVTLSRDDVKAAMADQKVMGLENNRILESVLQSIAVPGGESLILELW